MKKKMIILNIKWMFLAAILTNPSIAAIAEKNVQNKKFVGTSPLNILDKNIYFHYGMLKKRRHEVIIPFFYRKPYNDLLSYGSGIDYRWYKKNVNKGLYRGIGVTFKLINWDYKSQTVSENIQKILLYPKIEYGYRYFLNKKISFIPHLIFDYKIGEIKSSDGEKRLERTNSNFSLMVGLHIDLSF
ncbi:hypothetical protein JYT44_03425 [Caldithrix abyssi]|nr:hypothetical protein [Caldithrix abyssi]